MASAVQIFHKNKWHSVEISQPFWTMDQKLLYGKIYMIASEKYGPENGVVLAEAYIFKTVHEHLKYNDTMEKQIMGLLA